MTANADPAAVVPKLPPLDIRPFQSQDVTQIRQLIADSKMLDILNC
jgi:hypothetical protein